MEGGVPNGPDNLEKIFRDYSGRRTAIIRALTTDVQEFSNQCDPKKDDLCLYGLPNEEWEVKEPSEMVPPELPEPVLGINFAKDGMEQKDWLYLIAVHSDVWLLAIAFYSATGHGFDKADRGRLFDMINDVPTITEVVKEQEKKSAVPKDNYNTRSKLNSKLVKDSMEQTSKGEDEEEENYCGECGVKYEEGEFWICCDTCETWYHGECVNMTSTKAKYVEKYKCPSCNNKRART